MSLWRFTWPFVRNTDLPHRNSSVLTATVTATREDVRALQLPGHRWPTLSDVGGVAVLGVVMEAESDGLVDGDVVEVGGVDEAEVGGFVADGECAAGDAGKVGDGELLADFAVGVGDDVCGVGVDAEEAGDGDVEAGFFFDLADGALLEGFADVHGAAG